MKKINILIKKSFKRIKIHRELRLSIIALLGIIIIASSLTAYSASKEPSTIKIITPTYVYTKTGLWDYQVYIENNSLYDTDVLGPEEDKYFRKLIEKIDIFFIYEFFANQESTINGSYEITADLQTSLWSKNFTIVPITDFNSSSTNYKFTEKFPLDISPYEDFIKIINEETGTTTLQPQLIIKCSVSISAITDEESVQESLSTSIEVAIEPEIITIDGNLKTTITDSLEKTEKIYKPGVTAQTNTWTSSSIILVIIFIGFVLITESDLKIQKSITKEIKKIQKKYGDWIVEVEEAPKRSASINLVITKSLEDLIKLSEELGKPIIHYSANEKTHTYYVLDEAIHYQYKITSN